MNSYSLKWAKVLMACLLVFALVPMQLFPGQAHAAIVENVYAFGENTNGRLGLGGNPDQLTPAVLSPFSSMEVAEVSAGYAHTLLLTAAGEVYSFGSGADGRLGHGDVADRTSPTKIAALDGVEVKAVAAGKLHSLVLTVTGEVYAFGSAALGQLGQGNTTQQTAPVKISGLPVIKAIAAGGTHSLLLTGQGEVYSFGNGGQGRTGHGDQTHRNSPTLIAGLSQVKAISAGEAHSLALTEDGDVYTFGLGSLGRLGHGDAANKLIATKIAALADANITIAGISAGYSHSLVVSEGGAVYSFGNDFAGVLGHGGDDENEMSPRLIAGLTGTPIRTVAAGGQHSVVLAENGDIYAFGYGFNGQLGLGHRNNVKVPTKVGGLLQARKISAGFNHTIAIASEEDNMTYSVDVSATEPIQFYPKAAGYTAVAAAKVDITRSGTGTITNLAASIGGPDAAAFEFVTPVSSPVLNADTPTANFWVKPVIGLAAGSYEAAVTVTADRGVSESFNVRFTVTAQPTYTIAATPAAPISFGEHTEGYGAIAEVDVLVARTGTGDIENLVVQLEAGAASGFMLGTSSEPAILNDNIHAISYKVRPKLGLTLGVYTDEIRITANNGISETIPLSFTVNSSPKIAEHPADVTADEGTPASFSVVAAGTDLTYQWQVDTGSGFADLSGQEEATLTIPAVDPSLNGNRYRVIVSGRIAPPATSSGATLNVNPIPAKPVITSIVAGDKQVRLNWNPVAHATTYAVYASIVPGVYTTPIVTVGHDVYSYDATELTNGTPHYFVVKALNGTLPGPASDEVGATPQVPAPGAPTLLSAVAGNALVDLTWSEVDGATEYAVYRSELPDTDGAEIASVTGTVYQAAGLVNGTMYYFAVKAINPGGTSAASNRIGATPYWPPEDTQEQEPPVSNTGFDIYVNGNKETAGTVTRTVVNGRDVATVVVDEKKLQEKLAVEGVGSVVLLPLSLGAETVIGELNGRLFQSLENNLSVVEFRTERATYKLPASLVGIDGVAAQLGGVDLLQDIRIRIEIAEPMAETVKLIEQAAENGTFAVVAPPVYFTVTASYGGKSVEIATFDAYVERSIVLPEGVDPDKITTGIVMEQDGTIRHVPTKVVLRENRYHAVINSLTNSPYAVVWNPLQFSDVQGHWSAQAVNDMASRMVVGGIGGGKFNPDQDVTRAEFAAMIARGLGIRSHSESDASAFADVASSDPLRSEIDAAHAYGLIDGFEDGTFRPNERITREQAMAIIAKAMPLTKLRQTAEASGASLESYADAAAASDWALDAIADCLQYGIVSGRSGSELAPAASITRAEAAAIVQRLLQRSELI